MRAHGHTLPGNGVANFIGYSSDRVPPATLALGSIVSLQAGHAIAKALFPLAGPWAVVAMRLGFAAVLLLLLWRPRLPTDRRALGLIMALGGAIAGMNAFVYRALAVMPLGITTTIAFLGPLTIAIAGSRRLLDLLWACLAGGGVFLLTETGGGPVTPTGVVFAVATGACWATYIMLNTAVGARTTGGQGLAWATALAALLIVPVGAVHAGEELVSPLVLLGGLAVALLTSVIAYSLDLEALRRMPPRVFGVLLSLEPAIAALAGLVLLGEHLHPLQWLAICSVVAASTGATWTRRSPSVSLAGVRRGQPLVLNCAYTSRSPRQQRVVRLRHRE